MCLSLLLALMKSVYCHRICWREQDVICMLSVRCLKMLIIHEMHFPQNQMTSFFLKTQLQSRQWLPPLLRCYIHFYRKTNPTPFFLQTLPLPPGKSTVMEAATLQLEVFLMLLVTKVCLCVRHWNGTVESQGVVVTAENGYKQKQQSCAF